MPSRLPSPTLRTPSRHPGALSTPSQAHVVIFTPPYSCTAYTILCHPDGFPRNATPLTHPHVSPLSTYNVPKPSLELRELSETNVEAHRDPREHQGRRESSTKCRAGPQCLHKQGSATRRRTRARESPGRKEQHRRRASEVPSGRYDFFLIVVLFVFYFIHLPSVFAGSFLSHHVYTVSI